MKQLFMNIITLRSLPVLIADTKDFLPVLKHTFLMNMEKFMGSSLFTQEQKAHSRTKPYKWNKCGKFFKHSSHLTPYQTIHTKEKWFF
jgi:phospholipase C